MMKTTLNLTFAVLASVTLLSLLEAAGKRETTTPPGKACIYKQSGGQPREMQVYFPLNHDPAKAKVPGLILFHGGGWVGGDLSQFQFACHYFASRGLVAATANYQMLEKTARPPAGESRKRVCVTDAKSAIRWFRQHAGELGIDPARIITGGGSAGGHISVLATTNPGLSDPADPKEVDPSVSAYLLFNPAFSPEDRQDAEVDALRHIKASFAPAIVFFGDQDNWQKGWGAVHARLQSLGCSGIDVQIAPHQKHGFYREGPWSVVTLIAADRFLVQQGFLTGEPTLAPPSTGEKFVPAPAK